MPKLSADFLQKWSIRSRLAITHAIVTILILLVVTLFMYWALLNSLQKENYQFLSNEIKIIQGLLQKSTAENPLDKLKQEIIWEPTILQHTHYRYYCRLLNSSGNVIMETPGINTLTRANNLLSLANTRLLQSNQNYTWKATRYHYYLMATKIKNDTGEDYILQVILFSKQQVGLLRDYQRALVIVLILGGLLAALTSAFIARESIAPLQKILETTRLISTKKLHQRIDPTAWPKELTLLAISFNEMLDRIQRGYEQLTQFSEDLAHELRTPINNLMLTTEIALSQPRSITYYQNILTSNLEEYNNLSRMINNMLFLARSDNDQIKLQYTQFDARQILFNICEFLEIIAQEKNMQLSIEGQAIISADLSLFKQVINNIIINAIYYSHPDSLIKIIIQQNQYQTIINVQDSGIGIAPAHLAKIFDRFYRTDAARAQNTGGTGLGLAIAKSIMNLHHGSIEVISKLYQGTTVRLSFPNSNSID